MVFGLLKRRKDMTPFAIYRSVMDQARQPTFFAEWGVPDTMGGRFDMLIAHAILVFRRLNQIDGERAEEAKARAQAFSDILFKDLDRALRDTGVSDRKVPKRLKRLATAYLGRGQAIGEALDAKDLAALGDAIERNSGGIVFAVDDTSDEATAPTALNSRMLAAYVAQSDQHLAKQPDGNILEGQFTWPAPAMIKVAD